MRLRRFVPALALLLAAAPVVTGCAAGASSAGPTQPKASEIARLVASGALPSDFRPEAGSVRLIASGPRVAATWSGPALASSCAAQDGGSPAGFVSILLLQDVGLTDVQRCGEFWQATQADGSRVLWNDAANAER